MSSRCSCTKALRSSKERLSTPWPQELAICMQGQSMLCLEERRKRALASASKALAHLLIQRAFLAAHNP